MNFSALQYFLAYFLWVLAILLGVVGAISNSAVCFLQCILIQLMAIFILLDSKDKK